MLEALQSIIAQISPVWTAGIAVVSALIAILGALRAGREARRQARFDWDRQFMAWADRTLLTLSQLSHLERFAGALSDEEAARRHLDALSTLSARIDEGRLFFRNRDAEKSQFAGKEAAYRGFRPAILDCLVAAYDAAEAGGPDTLDTLRKCQRAFVSEAQTTIDPAWRRKISYRD